MCLDNLWTLSPRQWGVIKDLIWYLIENPEESSKETEKENIWVLATCQIIHILSLF